MVGNRSTTRFHKLRGMPEPMNILIGWCCSFGCGGASVIVRSDVQVYDTCDAP